MRRVGYVLAAARVCRVSQSASHYSEDGGAPLLGVKGVCIISHGRSNAKAIKNAIRVAADFASSNMNERIEEELREFAEAR